jgi:mannosyltransferase OCH1-like enzyme
MIHLSFYFMDDKMPPSVAEHVDELKAQNGDFQLIIWGPKESRALVAKEYPQFLRKYDAYPYPIQRSDFSRYAILHKHGGVYMDMDYTIKKPVASIFEFLDSTYPRNNVFVNESPNAVFLRRLSNSFMISRGAGHPFWMHVMHTTSVGTGLSSHQRVMSSTGPQAMDRAYRSFKTPKTDAVGVLPCKRFNPCGVCSRGTGCKNSDVVFAYHENAGGWNSGTSKMYNNMQCNMWWMISLLVFVILVVALTSVLVKTRKRCGAR